MAIRERIKKVGKKAAMVFLVPTAGLMILGAAHKAYAEGRSGPQNLKPGFQVGLRTGSSDLGSYSTLRAGYAEKIKGFDVGAGGGLLEQGSSQYMKAYLTAAKHLKFKEGNSLKVGVSFIPVVSESKGGPVGLSGPEFDVGSKFSHKMDSENLKKFTVFGDIVNLTNQSSEYGRVGRLGVKFDLTQGQKAVVYLENDKLRQFFEGRVGKIKKVEVLGKVGFTLNPNVTASPIAGLIFKGDKGSLELNYEQGELGKPGQELLARFKLNLK